MHPPHPGYLPEDFDRDARAAPIRVTWEIEVPASPEQVWEALVQVERWPLWHPGVSMAVLRGDAPTPGTRLDWAADGMRIRSTLFQVEPHRRLGWTLRTLGARGALRWSLEPASAGAASPTGSRVTGSRVRLDEWWTGLTARLLRRTLQQTLDVARAAWLERLRARVTPSA
jgi:uncharacterized protein YndB with AHSA1/START domain